MSSVACNLHRLLLSLILNSSKRKNPTFMGWGFCLQHEEPDDYLLSHGRSALSSAWSRFTVLFGMGRGGTNSLWSSGMTCCCSRWVAKQPIREEVVERSSRYYWGCECFGVKPGTTRDTQ